MPPPPPCMPDCIFEERIAIKYDVGGTEYCYGSVFKMATHWDASSFVDSHHRCWFWDVYLNMVAVFPCSIIP